MPIAEGCTQLETHGYGTLGSLSEMDYVTRTPRPPPNPTSHAHGKQAMARANELFEVEVETVCRRFFMPSACLDNRRLI